MLYPLKFKPILKKAIWGGEAWGLSAVKDNVSVVSNGALAGQSLQDLLDKNAATLMGQRLAAKFGAKFPLLVKLIDAGDDLSIQVHPDDKFAAAHHQSFGKTEMWYILSAEKGAKLVSGFKNPLTPAEYKQMVAEGNLPDALARYAVKPGDAFFIPAGRVHAIGRGILLAEVQQTSDITYRIFDYNRKDASGKTRQLHTELAAQAANLADTAGGPAKPRQIAPGVKELCKSQYFTVNILKPGPGFARDYNKIDSFLILMCTQGAARLNYAGGQEELAQGETCLIPHDIKNTLQISGGCELLEAYI